MFRFFKQLEILGGGVGNGGVMVPNLSLYVIIISPTQKQLFFLYSAQSLKVY